jgi:DNA-binding NarL/FixJ family response regulator
MVARESNQEENRALPVRVFLIEDSVIIRQRLAESIEQEGRIEVVGHADTEDDAVRALRETACDAVVFDLQLRRGNGLAALKAVRSSGSEGARRPVCIVLTNYAFPHYRTKSLELGADYFFDKAREYDSVREVLERMACSREAERSTSRRLAS